MAGIPAQDNSTNLPLTQEEFNAIQPLSAPPSLQGFPHGKRMQFSCRMFRIMKRTNDEAAARFKERLQPSEILHMAQQEELTVLQRVSDSMQSLPYTPNDAEIERAYDTQSAFELQNCSKLESFVNKVKSFHRRAKNFFISTKDKIADAFCMGGTNTASHTAQNAPLPSPPVLDTKTSFLSDLNEAINKMNVDVSDSHNGGRTILQPDQVIGLAMKLETLMANDLGQKYAGTPLTEQQQEGLYVQAGNEFLQRIRDVECFVETVKAFLGMVP